MIDAIRGEMAHVGTDHVVIDTGSVSYRVDCPTETLRQCHDRRIDQVFVHLIVREDTIQLYGFGSPEERELFRKLLTVGQVGPRLALQVLSALPRRAFIDAIANNDVSRLTAVKGIGTKTAQRILIDLRDKVGGVGEADPADIFLTNSEETALRALTSKALGFSAREARHAIEQLRGEEMTTEELIRRGLAILGRGS
jgi:Holliday junction DNA helicase RuvA